MQILAWLAVVWPETFLFCPLYVFIHFSVVFLYGALYPRSCKGSCAREMSIIIILLAWSRDREVCRFEVQTGQQLRCSNWTSPSDEPICIVIGPVLRMRLFV